MDYKISKFLLVIALGPLFINWFSYMYFKNLTNVDGLIVVLICLGIQAFLSFIFLLTWEYDFKRRKERKH